jgi:hypothetical protein
VAAQLPEHMPFYMTTKQQQLEDPAIVELFHDLAAMIDWEAQDPRVPTVGDRLVAALEAAHAQGWDSHEQEMPDALAQLLDSIFLDSVPIAHRLLAHLEQHGWRGWAKLERIDPK